MCSTKTLVVGETESASQQRVYAILGLHACLHMPIKSCMQFPIVPGILFPQSCATDRPLWTSLEYSAVIPSVQSIDRFYVANLV
jgi:hypothetical protein